MGFLQRSKSAAVVEQTTKEDNATLGLASLPTAMGTVQRPAALERPRTAPDNASSFSRPRTANASVGRPVDFPLPSFRIDYKACGEVFSFPTPSPRLPSTQHAAVHLPSSLGQFEPVDIGLAIGSPDQARTSWDEPAIGRVTNTTTAPPPPTRPPPVIPEHPDLEMPLTSIKKKKPGWKTFGGFFIRKPTKAAISTEADSKAPVQDKVLDELAAMLSDIEPPKPPVHPRTSALTRQIAGRGTEQVNDSKALRSPLIIKTEGLSPMFRSIQGLQEPRQWVDDPRKDSPLSLMSPMSFKSKDDIDTIFKPELPEPGTPTLILDLPDPKFERYSIMFERVLNGSQPSLLERRQSRLNKSLSIKRLDLAVNEEKPPEVPRLQLNGVPQRSATSPSLTRIGKKMLSPISEVFSSLRSPRTVRRSKTLPPSEQKLTTLEVETGLSPSISRTHDDVSMPATPMTFHTISDCESVDDFISDDLPLEFEKAEAAWAAVPSASPEESLDPYLRMKQMEKHVLQASVAKQISVGKAMAELRQSVAWRHPVRQRLVELNKDRSSTIVVIESAV